MGIPKFNQGEIAITVNTKFGENWGKVVELKEYLGRRYWPELKEPQHIWLVDCLCNKSYFYYLYPQGRNLSRVYQGQLPEYFLKRITPVSGQVVLDLQETPVEVSDRDASV